MIKARKVDSYPINLEEMQCSESRLSGLLPEVPYGSYGFHIEFDSSRYPMHRHLCYMHAPEDASADEPATRRFSEMEFRHDPPGIAVGPWPGWRGIPQMPEIRLRVGETTNLGRFNFWGDEFSSHHCRAWIVADLVKDRFFSLQWSDPRLRPLSMILYPSAKKSARPMTVVLKPELQGAHPRLLFSADHLENLRKRKESSHHEIWQDIEKLLANWHLDFAVTTASRSLAGPERLHEMDRVILSAFAALMTQDQDRIDQALAALQSFLTRALEVDYEPMQIDTQSGECLFTLCLGYDWLYENMEPDERLRIKSLLFKVAERVWAHLGYQRRDYGQAHFLGCSHGLLAFSFLFWQEHPRAQEWTAWMRGVLDSVIAMLPSDGFFPHGINLWIYEHTFIMRYLELLRHCADENLWHTTLYWENASLFRQASLGPDARYGITFGDPQYRVAGDSWIHHLIATRTGSTVAQSLAKTLANVPVDGVDFRSVPARRKVWEYLYYNPDIPESTMSQSHHFFLDGGQIFWRCRTDPSETLITFRAGSPLGMQRYQAGEWSGYGHSDPCNGAFLIMRNHGFLACGPGPVYRRDSALHNTITIDGQGQIGDSLPWAPDFYPQNRFAEITRSSGNSNMVWVEANLAPSYPDHLAVHRLTRRLCYLKPDVVLVHDKVELGTEHDIQWNLHTYGRIIAGSSVNLQINDGEQILQLHCLLPEHVCRRQGVSEFVPAYPHAGERDRFVQFYKKSRRLEFLFLMVFGKKSVEWNFESSKTDAGFCHLILMQNGQKIDLSQFIQ
jgi:hypothetical protein